MVFDLKIRWTTYFPALLFPKKYILTILGCAVYVLSVVAQPAPVFEVIVDPPDNISIGTPFELIFRLRNVEGKNFRPPAWDKNLRVLGGPSVEQSMGFINGRSYTQQGWRFLLEPQKTGTITIEPASVTADGKTLRSQPLTLTVGQGIGGNTSALQAGGDVFIVSECSHKTAYVGQQITWRILLYTLVGVDGADLIEAPDFKGFYAQEKKRFDTRVRNQTIQGRKYAVKTLYESALYPQEEGDQVIQPVKIRASIETPGSFFGGPPKLLQTQPLKIAVKPIPIPLPDDFTGGIGRYVWEAKADKETLSTDDALTFTVTVRGNGDARRFAAPKLTLPSGLEAFDPKVLHEEVYENGEEMIHEQTIEYAILPKEPGSYTFQPGFSWFNPDSNQYLQYTANAITLQITPGVHYKPGGSDTTLTTATELPETSFTGRIRDFLGRFSPVFWLSTLLGLGAFILLLVWMRRKSDTMVLATATGAEYEDTPGTPPVRVIEPVVVRTPSAELLERARALALAGNSSAATYSAILKALQQFLCEKLSLTPAQISREEVSKQLLARQVPPITVQALLLLWDQCETAVYGGQFPNATPQKTFEDAERLVRNLR
jgi:hypothetical protein